MIHTIRINFGPQIQPQIEIQQGDYNSRTIQAFCYTTSGTLMNFDGNTVSVVYDVSGNTSAEYPVAVSGNVLTFTMPGISSASATGSGKLQLRIYGEKSLLHSAIIPYTVKASLDPGPAEEDQVPMLVLLVQQAQEAIDSANAASKRANDVANDVQEKLDSGAFVGPQGEQGEKGEKGDTGAQGAPGLDAPQIDDTQITTTNPWSSMQIVKTLCPPFTVSGPIVQCTPVANYPLGVQVEITPTQEGTGDPSSDNIRPITGRDAVSVMRCGKNLLKPPGTNKNSAGIVFTANDDGTVTINGTSTDTAYYNYFDAKNQLQLAEGDYVLIPGSNLTRITCKNISTNTLYGSDVGQNHIVHITAGKYIVYIAVNTGITADNVIARPQVVLGTTATPFEPYTGDTYDIALPETVYGGTLDVETGTLTVTQAEIESYNGENLPGQWISDRDIYAPGTQPSIGAQVVYELAESQIIQLDPQQILALSGTNTLFADAGSVTVSGLSDPVAIIASLQARVSALESAALN